MKKRVLLGVLVAVGAFGLGATALASSSKQAGATPLPSSSCGKLQYSGSGSPDYIIASDLPLQGANRALTTEMAKAVAFILGQQGWKAGKYTVGFQSCDDSTAQAGGYDTAKCTANANAYSQDSSVLGIVGTFNSGCAKLEIPINNRASIAMVSPSNTYPGLTVSGPGTAPGEPGVYYPTGKRNYARVVWTDRSQGAADVLFAKNNLHLKDVYVLTDKTTYGAGIATLFKTDGPKVGVKIAGYQAWNPQGTTFQSLATAVKQSGADGVFLGGNVCFQGGKVIKDLRSVLGASFPIIVPDGFTPLSATWTTSGGAALGVYNSQPGIPINQLKGAGAAFASGFAKVNGGKAPDPYTVYAAQAAQVLLGAIAKSDGTRAGVVSHLTNLTVNNGLLGNFKINANGDTTLGTVTFYQVDASKTHGKFIELLTPPTSLTK
ncbi:MAG: branched-chain amino acid ABC transporter substrate-binding protein [Actinobacteria bacterium]|nr:branched-chain amino acid ABC transporter substrate-binding protein [Actinomycetota bacterium]